MTWRAALQLAPEVSITLPPEVFHRDIASDRLKFIYFRSSKLFVGSRRAAASSSSVDDVITASVGPEVAFDLPNCVVFIIPNRQARRSRGLLIQSSRSVSRSVGHDRVRWKNG